MLLWFTVSWSANVICVHVLLFRTCWPPPSTSLLLLYLLKLEHADSYTCLGQQLGFRFFS